MRQLFAMFLLSLTIIILNAVAYKDSSTATIEECLRQREQPIEAVATTVVDTTGAESF